MRTERATVGPRVHLEWGPIGAELATKPGDIAVVVDVLSFTTTLTVAVEAGSEVYPYRWNDESAVAYAAERGAVLAVGRFEARDAPDRLRVSLSPHSLRNADAPSRLVLPSPNGSTVSSRLGSCGASVLGAAFRNRTAVADELILRCARPRVSTEVEAADVVLVASSERWPDGSLRPAVEDFWGAGAVIAALVERGATDLTPEARSAAAAFTEVAPELRPALLGCTSGRELVDAGFAEDVEIAAELDSSGCVPVLSGERFVGRRR